MSRRKRKREWTPFERAQYVNLDPRIDIPAVRKHLSDEVYKNSFYQVDVTRYPQEDEPGKELVHLSIKTLDKSARHDWREFQRIKNELVGPEIEAVELYPAESRLVDTSNQYHLWCFPAGDKLPFGYSERLVSETSSCGAKQRKWSDEDRPKDLKDLTPEAVKRMTADES